ncbi:Rad17 cell cycle checkpoint protein-domain-containing protein [Mycena alexandri]|uniref:Rad17 cell cycle checkpoint protein-domain-containing protein n=1 Tax=Mycena alexandri TaxID=1745969 RepID=A0AAD6SHI2_9AGAR|nr:Rad17 cell cycle checkpoint protein-domain-containing protein [Mycena alexandri]
MPPKSSQAPSSNAKSATKKLKISSSKATTVKLSDTAPSNSPRINPLTAFANTQVLSSTTMKASQPSQTSKSKGKGKEKEKEKGIYASALFDAQDDRLWVDIYEPTTEAELAVHVKKVQDVRRWLDEAFVGGPSGKLRKYRRILALTGPAGTAKTATMRVLARELDCEILEWRNAMEEGSSRFGDDGQNDAYTSDHESLFFKFEAFLTRASTCQTIFADASDRDAKLSSSSPSSSSSNISATRPHKRKRQLILLEDLPNVLHAATQQRFHAALQSLIGAPQVEPVPVVVIVSDAGTRGEARDERLASGVWGGGREGDGVLDVRVVLGRDLLGGPYVTQIGFNPIAPTLMKKALQTLVSTHFASAPKASGSAPTKEMLDIVVETSNGDIRSAIMALQFSCLPTLGGSTGKPARRKGGGAGGGGAKLVLEAVTRREQSLALFHFMGRVMYNKRKGDPPNPSATAKDIQRDQALDATLKDPPKLPKFLAVEERRTSRVNVDALYADSPIDSSLFSLYVHQNYTQFCNETEECEGVTEWLSWVDSSGGEAWYQANPHRFHLLTLGTLHSLPSPVPRRSQKMFKPEFFEYLNKEKDAWEAVRDVRGWIMGNGAVVGESDSLLGTWSRAEVVTGLGAILKARDLKNSSPRAPASHRLFSSLPFANGENRSGMRPLVEGDVASDGVDIPGEDDGVPAGGWSGVGEGGDREGGGWLEGDEIEEF